MKIQWIAHSCFKVYLESGKTLLFDPFDDDIGYTRSETQADIVLMSHDHHDHNSLKHIKEGYELIRTPGVFQVDDIRIEGLPCYHDKEEGKKRGENIIFKVQAEGLTLVHLGDQIGRAHV